MPSSDYFFEKLETNAGLNYILRAREGVPDKGMVIKPHVHFEHEIMWFYKARGSYSIGREKFNIQNNTLVYVSPLTLHDMELDFSSDHERFILQYEHTVLTHLKYPLPTLDPHVGVVAYLTEKDAQRIQFIFEWFSDVHGDGYSARDVKPIMILLLNTVLQHAQRSERVYPKADNPSIFSCIINFVIDIETRTSFNISLNDAARSVGLSASHFSRSFKKVMCVSFKEYLLRKKITLSMQLLRNTDLSITDIAYRCEFTDTAYYCYQFRKVIGVTPRKFRNSNLTSEQLKTQDIVQNEG
ncbi:helix-turn-helix transcriptional regulator [Enterobacter huaxiensis]